jgi:hypothetical protein
LRDQGFWWACDGCVKADYEKQDEEQRIKAEGYITTKDVNYTRRKKPLDK